MEPEQELVYGWLGLNPALLLDPIPNPDNLLVRVVRPRVDPETVIEEARLPVVASCSRRRRRGRGGAEGRLGADALPGETASAESADMDPRESEAPALLPRVQITPLPDPTAPLAPIELVTVAVSRSGGGLPEGFDAQTTPAPGPTAAAPEDADASGEPRRRRRRSSALV